MKLLLTIILVLVISYAFSLYPTSAKNEVPYPDGFRYWAHVKTAIIKSKKVPQHGFHHVYANGLAIKGYQEGKFQEGSIIVFDVLQDTVDVNGDVIEGARR